jgi:Tfp pilus assembly protein PilV
VKKFLNNKKGLSIVECIIAMVITTVTVISLISMQSLAWRGAGKSDYMGRAVGILQRELERYEFQVMCGNTKVDALTCLDSAGNNSVCGQPGTMYTITSAIIPCNCSSASLCNCPVIAPAVANNWRVNVRVNWTGSPNGIRSGIMVSRQF